jgi:anaerobic dimethyl sulfoxide reductase subunit C
MTKKSEMLRREWPLVGFTLLAQTGVGIFLTFALPLALSRPAFTGDARPVLLRALLFVLGLLVAGGAFSFFHLGNPRNAPKTLSNLGQSWLSREILFELVFIGGLAVLILLEWMNRGDRSVRALLYGMAGLAGAGLVLSMSRIYRLKSVPPWDRAFTPLSFIMTALTVGAAGAFALTAAGAFGIAAAALPFSGALKSFALLFLGLDLAVAGVLDPFYGIRRNLPPSASPRPSIVFVALFFMRLGLLVLAAGLLAWTGAVLPAFASVFVSEVLGRMLFYASFRKAGL